MDLLIVRHAIAEERAAFSETGKDDSERPLTPAGRRKFKGGARGLRRIVPTIDLLATSALARAVETAEILSKAYGIGESQGKRGKGGKSGKVDSASTVRLRELEPDASPAALTPWLRKQRGRSVVAVVGHEPHLSTLIEYLLTGGDRGFVDLKKGGACLLALGDDPKPGGAQLRWLLTASQLRDLDR